MKRLLLLLIVLLAGGPLFAAAAEAPLERREREGVGRLFFTPSQRQELDRRRQLNIQETVVAVNESRFTLNGQVTRSSGKSTTWVNGAPQHDTYRPADPATVPVRTGENEPSVPLKVGQTLDKAREVVTDGLAGGAIKVERRGPARGR
jgi:hypothetical protein